MLNQGSAGLGGGGAPRLWRPAIKIRAASSDLSMTKMGTRASKVLLVACLIGCGGGGGMDAGVVRRDARQDTRQDTGTGTAGTMGGGDDGPPEMAVSTCSDKKLDGDETDIDCGGSCSSCAVGS